MEKIFNSLNLCLFYLSKKRQKHNNTWINYLTSTLIHVIENITFRNWQVMHVMRCVFVCPNVVVGNKIIVMFCYYIVLVSHFPTKPVDCRLCVILEYSWLIKYHFCNACWISLIWFIYMLYGLISTRFDLSPSFFSFCTCHLCWTTFSFVLQIGIDMV